MTPFSPSRICSRDAGFSLVEVTVALGIMGFCLLAIFGLLPVGITSNQNAIATTGAVGVATNILADARAAATVANAGTGTFTSRVGFSSPPTVGSRTLYFSEDGGSASSGSDAKYRAVVTTTADALNPSVLWVRAVLSWPAQADPANAAGSFAATTAVYLLP